MNEVSKDETNALWDRSLDVDAEEIPAPVGIRLLSDRIRISLEKPLDLIVEIVQVVLRALHPLETAVGGIHQRQAQLDAVLQVALKVAGWAYGEPSKR